MSIELKVPEIGESITEVEIGDWLKKSGDNVQKDEPVVTLESEKATVELPAPGSGRLGQVLKQKGDVARVGEVVGLLEESTGAGIATKAAEKREAGTRVEAAAKAAEPPSSPPTRREATPEQPRVKEPKPAAAPSQAEARRAEPPELAPAERIGTAWSAPVSAAAATDREEEEVPMSRLRRTVAKRLVEAQHSAALLTTFNEVDMSEVISLRKAYGESFQQKYGVKLGFMSFFVKAAIEALKQYPTVNAEVRGSNIVYHNFFDIGIAVGGGKGLAVPVLRNAERMSFAEIEKAIGDFAVRAKENKLKVDELEGGTFTISNGGIYGSLLSTPIVNPPQSGVLGLHAIQPRPVAHDNNVVIRPMMYVALTYDHRIVDGREAVSFLRRIKDVIERPARMLIEV